MPTSPVPAAMNWITELFNTTGFPARWNCGTWSSLLGWTHIVSDAAIFGAYVGIPVVLTYFARRRKDLPYPWIVWMFAAFILSCGTGHLIEAIIFYKPVYKFAGAWKLMTAVISWITVFGLIPVVPKLLTLRSPKELHDEVERRAAAEDELRRTNAQLEQFAYVASHDLKAPIRAIQMTTQFLREDLGNPEAVDKHLAALERRASRMEGLVSGLLTLARAGRTVGDPEPVHLGKLVRGILDSLGDLDSAHVQVEVEVDVEPFDTFRIGLEQVISNLVGNAIRHSESGDSQVLVRAHEAPGKPGLLLISVEDNGPGIAPEFRDRIFGLFQTLRARDEFESTGIGLTIVKKVLDEVGGTVTVGDSELGGAAFRVVWPKDPSPQSLSTGSRIDASSSQCQAAMKP